MMLSKETIAALIDLAENKLAMMCVSDCDELREKFVLQRALAELRLAAGPDAGIIGSFAEVPRRGRRRKMSEGERESGRF